MHLEAENRGRRRAPLSPRGKKRGKNEGTFYPLGPPHLRAKVRRARASRAGATFSRAPWGQPGRSPHIRICGGAAQAASRRARSGRPLTAGRRGQQQQHHQGPHLCARRGVNAAAAAARVWSNHHGSQAAPTAQTAEPRARALPPLHARSPARTSRARALALAPPAAVAADAGPPHSRAPVHVPAGSAETLSPLPGSGAGRACGARPAALPIPYWPQEARRCYHARAGPHCIRLSAVSFLPFAQLWAPLSSLHCPLLLSLPLALQELSQVLFTPTSAPRPCLSP